MESPSLERLPIIGIPAWFRDLAGNRFHMAPDEYVQAVVGGVKAIPVIIPVLGDAIDLQMLLQRLDGILVTGSPSNVEPSRYGGSPSAPGTLHDPARDAANLAVIPAAVTAGIPLLAICRGFQ